VLLLNNKICCFWLQLIEIDSVKVFRPNFKILVSLKKAFWNILSVFKIFLLKIFLGEIVSLILWFQILLFLDMIFEGAIIENDSSLLKIERQLFFDRFSIFFRDTFQDKYFVVICLIVIIMIIDNMNEKAVFFATGCDCDTIKGT